MPDSLFKDTNIHCVRLLAMGNDNNYMVSTREIYSNSFTATFSHHTGWWIISIRFAVMMLITLVYLPRQDHIPAYKGEYICG